MNLRSFWQTSIAATAIVGAAMAWTGLMGGPRANVASAAEGDRPAPSRDDQNPPPPKENDRPPGQGDRRPDARRERGNGGQGERPERGDRRPGPPPGIGRAIDDLKLTDGQKQKIEPIVQEFRSKQQQLREDFLKQMKQALTSEQYESLERSMQRPPGPPPRQQGNSEQPPQGNREAAAQPPSDPVAPSAKDPSKVAVTFTGGYETDPRDHGRPVILVASALGVTSDVFRDAFSRVKPASGGREPEPEQVRLNKQTLMHDLSPFGVTNERLDTVSNFYRYSSSKGQMWRNTPATAYATIRNDVVTAITITNPGAGYSSPPKVAVAGIGEVHAVVTLSFGTDFSKNGSIKEIVVKQ